MRRLIVFLLLSVPCWAQWTSHDIMAVSAQTKTSVEINHPYWDQIRACLLSGLQMEVAQAFGDSPVGTPIEISSPRFHKILTVTFYRRDLRPRPLIVYLPTLMQDDDGPETSVNVRMLLEAGNDVLYISNPLSPNYLRAMPVVRPLHLLDEANVVAATLLKMRQLGYVFPQISLYGVSYGAFLAAIVTARYPELIDGQTTLIYPPLDLAKSMRNLDEILAAADAPWWRPVDRLVGSDLKEGFQSALQAMQENVNFDESDSPGEVQFRFINRYGQNFSRMAEMLGRGDFLRSQQAKLFYWLDLAYKAGNSRLRILESSNDFLNEASDWNQSPEWLASPEHLLFHHNGGHDGFYDSAFFQRFIIQAMRP